MPIFNKTKCADCSTIVYIDPFQSKRLHETYIWEGLPSLLSFSIAVFHFKQSYFNKLSIICLDLLLLCQHFALCFCLPIISIILPLKSMHIPRTRYVFACNIFGTFLPMDKHKTDIENSGR